MTDKTFEAPKEVVELSEKATKALDYASTFIIETDEDYSRAAEVLKDYKTQAKELTAERVKITKPLDVSKKATMDFFRSPLDFLGKAESTIKKAMIAYQEKLEAKRREEERKLQEAADKERKYQEDLALKRLATAEKKGDEERIEQVEEEIEEIQTGTVAPVLASNKPKVQGISTRETWSGEVTDKMALIKAVAAGQAPETLLDVNTKTMNQMARAMKKSFNYPGVRAVSKKTIAA